jgi:hypothetical protein
MLSPRARRFIIFVAVVALAVGGVGYAVAGPSWLFVALLALGMLALVTLSPAQLPVLWWRHRS